eukprot:scaffold236_cov419-Prasinococcus_capsulatus_cf.AAC.39
MIIFSPCACEARIGQWRDTMRSVDAHIVKICAGLRDPTNGAHRAERADSVSRRRPGRFEGGSRSSPRGGEPRPPAREMLAGAGGAVLAGGESLSAVDQQEYLRGGFTRYRHVFIRLCG